MARLVPTFTSPEPPVFLPALVLIPSDRLFLFFPLRPRRRLRTQSSSAVVALQGWRYLDLGSLSAAGPVEPASSAFI